MLQPLQLAKMTVAAFPFNIDVFKLSRTMYEEQRAGKQLAASPASEAVDALPPPAGHGSLWERLQQSCSHFAERAAAAQPQPEADMSACEPRDNDARDALFLPKPASSLSCTRT